MALPRDYFPGRRHAHGGFTLVEVLVAIAILAISLMVIVDLRNDCVREVRAAVDFSDAWVYGARYMGEVETQEFLDDGAEGGLVEDNPAYRWDAIKSTVEIDVAGQYFPGQDRAAVPHKPKELLRIQVTIALVEPPPGHPGIVYQLVGYAKKRKPGGAPQ